MIKARLAMTAIAASAVAACAHPTTATNGRIASGGGYLGDWDFYPTACGARKGEVVLTDGHGSGEVVRVVDRSVAPSTRNAKADVHVARQGESGMVDLIFTDPACVDSRMELGKDGYRGEVAMDCQTGEGGHIVGKIDFTGCR